MMAQSGGIKVTVTDRLLWVEGSGSTKAIRLAALTSCELQEAGVMKRGYLRWEYVGNEQRHVGSTVQWKTDANRVEFGGSQNADFMRLYKEIVAKLDA